jgi:hypothetical protein
MTIRQREHAAELASAIRAVENAEQVAELERMAGL